jgi:hypothetical protein
MQNSNVRSLASVLESGRGRGVNLSLPQFWLWLVPVPAAFGLGCLLGHFLG